MIAEIIGLLILFVGGIFAAFTSGKRTERKNNEAEKTKDRIESEARIKGAIRDADNSHDWRGRLRDRK